MDIASAIGAVAGLSWLLVIGAIALTVVRASRGRGGQGAGTLIIGAIVLALILTTVSQGLVFIPPEERGVVISALPGRQGVRGDLGGGLNWIVPFFESVERYPISRQTYTMSSTPQEGQIQGDDSVQARTSDGQIVFVDASVIFAINPARVVDVHIRWQNNYVDNLIRPQARGIIRDAVAVYPIEDVYSTQRDTLTQQIAAELDSVLEEEGLILVSFVMRNIAFSDEYAASVEQKQIAEQEVQRQQFVVQQREQEAEQARQIAQGDADAAAIRADGEARALIIQAKAQAESRLIQAQAEAEALKLLAEAIADNPDVLTLQYIDKLAPNISVMLLPADNPFLFPLPEIGPPAPETTTVTATPEPTPEPTPTETAP
jgi:regulator of protease activity HflC (stomatin/prohibitin superfamily)